MHGWGRGLAKFRGEAPVTRNNLTLGEYLAEVTATGRFVVEGVEPKTDTDNHHYRAGRAHAELIEWLHGKGLSARNPLHALRKEFGSIVCQKAGVYVASRLLRHPPHPSRPRQLHP
jgi:hypothetical protein